MFKVNNKDTGTTSMTSLGRKSKAWVTSSDIRVASSNPQVASSDQWVTSSNTRVSRLKTRTQTQELAD